MATGWGRRERVEMQKVVVNQTPTATTAWFAGLSTANPNDDGQSLAEPTVTNGYARTAVTWTTLTVYTSVTADTASIASNSNALTWTSSGGGFSTGATNLTHIYLNTASTGSTEATYIGRAAIAVPQAVATAGITLTCAIGALQMGCISA